MTKTISATKKMLAMILAVLMMFSGMAVSASADTTQTAAPTVPAPTVALNETDKKLTVIPPTVSGYEVSISVSPLPSDPIKTEDNSLVYINLVEGKTYTVKAYVSYNGSNVYSEAVTKTLKQKQQAPAAPVPSKVTSTTITVAQVTGCEYKLEKASDKSVVYNWTDKIVLFEKLTADTPYLLSIRKKATDTKYASDAASVTVKTLKKADTVAADVPVLVDKTDKTVTVAEVEGVQFSIDKGKTWQTSGTFTGLTPNTIYGVIARKTFDKAVQDPNPTSGILEIKTNSRARYTAAPGKCTFTVAEGTIYAEKDIAVTVTGDGPAGSFKDMYIGEYGDTQLIPSKVIIGDREFPLTRSKDNVYVGNINPSSVFANQKNVEVKVEYIVKKFNGQTYVNTGKTDYSQHKIDVGAEWGVLTMLAELFTKAANLFLNTIPQFITDLFGSEAATKLFGGIMDLIGKIGKPATK